MYFDPTYAPFSSPRTANPLALLQPKLYLYNNNYKVAKGSYLNAVVNVDSLFYPLIFKNLSSTPRFSE
jgi:hypothetical protein